MSAPEQHRGYAPSALTLAAVTVSDSRTAGDDASGDLIVERSAAAGHRVSERRIVADEAGAIGELVGACCADPQIDAVILTGGTGFAPRDVTVEAVEPRFERRIEGFGELFRMLSWEEVGAAAMLSRATAGVVAGKPVFLLPGSPKAVALALERLILPELGHLVGQLRRPAERS